MEAWEGAFPERWPRMADDIVIETSTLINFLRIGRVEANYRFRLKSSSFGEVV